MADKPVTREEKYLAYLTGDYTGELPKPITRKEKYLYELCLKGIGGEISPEEIKNAVNEYLEKNPVKPGATTEQAQQIEQNKTDVVSLKEDKITKPAEFPTVGKILRVKSVNEDGTFICEWADGGSNLDVRINGESIVQDGITEIPIAQKIESYGLFCIPNVYNLIGFSAENNLPLVKIATERNISNRDNINSLGVGGVIDSCNFDKTVKAAMCDGKGATWTADEQAAARERMGAADKRQLDALWKLNQGISYEFQTDDTEAYQKTVPSGAKMASVKSIGGKTIVWNQMVQNGDFSLNSMWSAVGSTISVEGNTGIFTATEAALTNNKIEAYQILSGNVVKGHKYCVRFEYNLSVDINDQSVLNLGSVSTKIPVVGAGTWGKFNSIATVNVASNIFDLYFSFDSLSVGDTVKLRNVQLFDLTQMFGSGNEPSTREEFEAMFPADYYLYNAGELMSAPVNEVTYSDTKTQETSYQIPQAILNLPGYGWSAGDARNEVNWENKQYIQRVGAVDLGTLNWTASGDIQYDGNSTYKSNSLNTVIRRYSTYSANSICEKFNIVKVNDTNRNEYEYSIGDDKAAYPLQFTVKSTFCTDENDFKNKINGIMLYYELAEPIITDISDLIGNTFQEPLEVEAGGTFTFKNSNGDNYRIPVPSSEEYVISLAEVAK